MSEPVEEAVDLDALTGADRENALFGGGAEAEVMREDPPEDDEEEEVLEASDSDDDEEDDEEDDDELDEEIDRAESMYDRMREKVLASQAQDSPPPPVETPDDKYRQLAEKAVDALAAATKKPEPVAVEEEETDWSEDPSVIAAYRESYPNLDEEEVSRLIRQQKVVSGHEAQRVLEKELGPIRQKLAQSEQTNAQREALANIQAGFQGALRQVAQRSASHAYVANHYNADVSGSLLGDRLRRIGLENPDAMMGILRSPSALTSLVDGIVFEMESNYGNLDADDSDGQVESSTVAQVRSPRRQQKRNKKPSTAEEDADLRRETFGDAPASATWDFMQPSAGR